MRNNNHVKNELRNNDHSIKQKNNKGNSYHRKEEKTKVENKLSEYLKLKQEIKGSDEKKENKINLCGEKINLSLLSYEKEDFRKRDINSEKQINYFKEFEKLAVDFWKYMVLKKGSYQPNDFLSNLLLNSSKETIGPPIKGSDERGSRNEANLLFLPWFEY